VSEAGASLRFAATTASPHPHNCACKEIKPMGVEINGVLGLIWLIVIIRAGKCPVALCTQPRTKRCSSNLNVRFITNL